MACIQQDLLVTLNEDYLTNLASYAYNTRSKTASKDSSNESTHAINPSWTWEGSTTSSFSPDGQDQSRSLKRKQQNRAAQRAYRERKACRIASLEAKIEQYTKRITILQKENKELIPQIERLRAENGIMKAVLFDKVEGEPVCNNATRESSESKLCKPVLVKDLLRMDQKRNAATTCRWSY